MTIRIDYSDCFSRSLGPPRRGLSPSTLDGLSERAARALGTVWGEVDDGSRGFGTLPRRMLDDGGAAGIERAARRLRKRFDTLVVCGIGGSSLGARALLAALGHPRHNLLPAGRRRGMRLFFLENVDPDSWRGLLDVLELDRTLFCAVSKSGGTAETAGQLSQAVALLRGRYDDWRERLAVVTDPEQGPLREFVRQHRLAAFEVPPNIGGRFSVFSAVGLLPAAAAGLPVRPLLEGAAAMADRCREPDPLKNPAGLLAMLARAAGEARGRNMLVLMPYGDRLWELALWFRQLWAESLGKRTGRPGAVRHHGTTPVAALGTVDQHSQVQLYVDGPDDKLVWFVDPGPARNRVVYPAGGQGFPPAGYLAGRRVDELLSASLSGTRAALAAAGRPSVTIGLPRLDPEGVGGLMQLLMLATAVAGRMAGVDPYDQPGVEQGKRFAFGLMGRPGYEAEAALLARRSAGGRERVL